jgi:uncharacterized protein (DUF433 family)
MPALAGVSPLADHASRASRAAAESVVRVLWREPSATWLGHGLTSCTLCTDTWIMSTGYVSGRVPARYEKLVARQARAARTSKSGLVARYVIEKSLEAEFPGISFRDSVSGREAYLTGRRVAVWEVLAVHSDTKSVAKTADHFRWPRVLVTRAVAYARAFPDEIRGSRDGETATTPAAG